MNKKSKILHELYDSFTNVENKDLDWVEELLFLEKTKEFVVQDYIIQMKNLYIHLKYAEIQEEFELALKIFNRIKFTEENFIRLCKKTSWFNNSLKKDLLNIKKELNKTY